MLEPSASRFWQATLQSGLADAKALQECWDAIPPDKRAPEHIDRRLARQAVQTGVLTLWQAQQLISGRSGGFKIDRYVLIGLIGQGGMGRVYLAVDSRLNRRVALKILSPERVNNPRAIARFHREALVGAQLQHENLVRIYDEGESSGRCYLVMEYIEGKNIGQMITEGGPIPPAVTARLGRQVALGLEHAQRKGLIHRDVNPYNILVTRDGTAKLTDLGLAIDLADQDRVTRDGATVGTFDYVSPEQARHSHSVDTRSDIYSLGCTLYHMLTGQVPFPSASLPEKLLSHQTSDPEPIAKLVPDVPEGLAAVVARMMRKSAGDRYATPMELALALEPYADVTAGPDPGAPSRGGARPEATLTQISPAVPGTSDPAPAPAPTPPAPVMPDVPPPAVVEATLGTPASSDGVLGISLGVDLGPEVPLSQSGAAVRPRAKANTKPRPSPAVAPTAPDPSPVPAFWDVPPPAEVGATSGTPPSNDEGLLGLGIAVDLGPEPPLSQSGAAVRPRPKANPQPRPRPRPEPGPNDSSSSEPRPDPVRPPWVVPAAAAGLLAVVIVGALAYRSFVGGADASTPRAVKTGNAGKAAATAGGGSKSKGTPREPAVVADFVVIAADQTREVAPDLATAMRMAIGGRGYVVLGNRSPLKISSAKPLTMGGGMLVIKAAEGVTPVLEVEVKGDRPFLSTRAECPLRIEGVTIVARYVDPGANPAPVIDAGGNIALDRCSFRVEGQVPRARAVVLEGGTLTASGCWFENFDRALDLSCFAGSVMTVRQCMFVRTGAETPGAPPSGWAVRMRYMAGPPGKTGRRLVLDHCTARGQGFLDVFEFSAQAPVTVDLTACAVLADALVSWGPPGTPPTGETMGWMGRSDQYDIRGQSWVLFSPDNRPMPDGPGNLDAWTKALGPETDPISPPLRFATDPASARGPRDFAVVSGGVQTPGADPTFVGPGALPVPVARRRP